MLSRLKYVLTKILPSICLLLAVSMALLYESLIRLMGAVVFYFSIILLVLLFCALLVYTRGGDGFSKQTYSSHFSERKINVFFICLLFIYGLTIYFDLFVFGIRFYSVIDFFVSLFLLLFLASKIKKYSLFFVLIVFFLSFVVSTYVLFPPAYGNDTWRDSIAAEFTVKNGHTINDFNTAYPVPILPIFYSIISIMFGINEVSSSALVGIIYIILIMVLVFLVLETLQLRVNIRSFLYS